MMLHEVPAVGDDLATLAVIPTTNQLFIFSAITWNSHRIHYDQAYARAEGYDDVLVQSHLHAAFLARAVCRSHGSGARVRRIAWQNRSPASPGDVLTVSGKVTGVRVENDTVTVDYELEERNERADLCIRGWVTVELQRGLP
jgi:hydroxyacyl-ACP dehydratase HTD2-like protein with hotdog domain